MNELQKYYAFTCDVSRYHQGQPEMGLYESSAVDAAMAAKDAELAAYHAFFLEAVGLASMAAGKFHKPYIEEMLSRARDQLPKFQSATEPKP